MGLQAARRGQLRHRLEAAHGDGREAPLSEPLASIPYPGEREVAPGRLGLVQQFANTLDREHGRDRLSDAAGLAAVLAELGLLEPGAEVGEEELRAAREVREALCALALANNGGTAAPTELTMLERAAAAGRLALRFEGTETVLVPTAPGIPGALAALVAIVHDAQADGTWPRLKACRRDVCLWLFYDRSRNRSARWCQMAVCGNRTKTRAYRARR